MYFKKSTSIKYDEEKYYKANSSYDLSHAHNSKKRKAMG